MDKDLHTVVDELFDKIERLQAENEELKNDILNGVMCITCPDKNENCRLQAENEHYRKEAYRLADGLNKTENLAFTYKQALQEIREIARKCPLCEDCSGVEDCERYCGEEIAHELCSTKQMNNILTKINEVIGAEE